MQKVFIKNARVASHYALFLGRRGAIVNYLTCFENRAVLEIDMSPCMVRVLCETNKEADARRG